MRQVAVRCCHPLPVNNMLNSSYLQAFDLRKGTCMDRLFENVLHSRRRSYINHEAEANHVSCAVQFVVLVCWMISKCAQEEVKLLSQMFLTCKELDFMWEIAVFQVTCCVKTKHVIRPYGFSRTFRSTKTEKWTKHPQHPYLCI